MTDRKNIWDAASRSGLVLGLVSIAYLAITTLIAKFVPEGKFAMNLAVNLGTGILWAFKLWLCIWLMKKAMVRFYENNAGEVDNADVRRFGIAVALCSALLYSAFYLAYVLFIDPQSITQALDTMKEAYGSMLDAESLDAIEMMKPKMPAISFFSNFIWCFLFGTVLSAIFSRNIPPRNPFAGGNNSNEQQ